jgi:betaine-aldehyde dehydrogenase
VREEIFGPVLTVHGVRSDAEALAAANGLGDGLAGYVFAEDTDLAFALGRNLHVGEVRVGGTNLIDLAEGSAQSFWGSSGLGGHGDRDVLLAFCGNRIIGEENHALPL